MSELTVSLMAYLLLAAGLALSTYLFVSLKQELQQMGKRCDDLKASTDMQLEAQRVQMDAFQQLLDDFDRRTGQLPQLASPVPGMNTARRTQALRMHRRGERADQIAAALGIAQGEVDLLLKMQQSSASPKPALQA